MGCSEETGLEAGDGAGEPGTAAEPTYVDKPLVDSYTKAAGSPIDAGEEAPDPAAGDDEGHTECAALEGARPLRHREARDAAGGEEPEDDEEVVKTSSSTPSPLPSKAHRRTERSVPVTGTLLPPPRRPWKEHGKDFGLLVPEDRWSKHVAAKRREAQLIRRNLQDQLRMKALQWRQKENHFHRRYKPAIPAGTI
ncbi:hypothetical protein MRX96_036017 [Rhipicephalus microplus]